MSALVNEAALMWIFAEIAAERVRQEELHPKTADVPDGTGGLDRAQARDYLQKKCDRADQQGTLTYTHVLEEEVAEATAETDRAKLRKELIQIAAVCCRWVDKIDREAAR